VQITPAKQLTFEEKKTEDQLGTISYNVQPGERVTVVLDWIGRSVGSSLG